jgi:hypothetical protein
MMVSSRRTSSACRCVGLVEYVLEMRIDGRPRYGKVGRDRFQSFTTPQSSGDLHGEQAVPGMPCPTAPAND